MAHQSPSLLSSVAIRTVCAIAACMFYFGFSPAAQQVHAQVPIPESPLYRLYNPYSRDHFYTISAENRDSAIVNDNYIDEGVTGYVYNWQARGTNPLYRLFKVSSGDHFYTPQMNATQPLPITAMRLSR